MTDGQQNGQRARDITSFHGLRTQGPSTCSSKIGTDRSSWCAGAAEQQHRHWSDSARNDVGRQAFSRRGNRPRCARSAHEGRRMKPDNPLDGLAEMKERLWLTDAHST